MDQEININLVPPINIELYCTLFKIENVLRELIIESLSSLNGPYWYKNRIPGDILEKYKSGRVFERSIRWTQMISHHPLYYIDFSDLRKIIERTDNWNDIFRSIFSKKEIITANFSELEPIRNKIAHNRKASNADLIVVKGVQVIIHEAIGDNKFNSLLSNCTQVLDIKENLEACLLEMNDILFLIKKYQILKDTFFSKSVFNKWWFDETYLGINLTHIINYYNKTIEYKNLTRDRGAGHLIEKWVNKSNIDNLYLKAHDDMKKLIKEGL